MIFYLFAISICITALILIFNLQWRNARYIILVFVALVLISLLYDYFNSPYSFHFRASMILFGISGFFSVFLNFFILQDYIKARKFNADGYNYLGYDRNGIDRQGFNKSAINKKGYDKSGFDKYGLDSNGYNAQGKDLDGYDFYGFKDGYNRAGFDNQGYNINGVNKFGFDRNGYNTQVFPFFQRHMTLLDTNILMADETYDGLFNFFINYGVHITILESVFDELVNIKDSRTHPQHVKRLAFIGLNRVSQLQDANLLTLGNIGIQTIGKVYADPIIIRYLKTITNKSIALITNDLDVKIRANHFKGSADTQAVLGKDLIKELYR